MILWLGNEVGAGSDVRVRVKGRERKRGKRRK